LWFDSSYPFDVIVDAELVDQSSLRFFLLLVAFLRMGEGGNLILGPEFLEMKPAFDRGSWNSPKLLLFRV